MCGEADSRIMVARFLDLANCRKHCEATRRMNGNPYIVNRDVVYKAGLGREFNDRRTTLSGAHEVCVRAPRRIYGGNIRRHATTRVHRSRIFFIFREHTQHTLLHSVHEMNYF